MDIKGGGLPNDDQTACGLSIWNLNNDSFINLFFFCSCIFYLVILMSCSDQDYFI